MSNFTCNSCMLSFPTSQDQRDHMKSEWHRYNLKRRVAQLPPISEDLFNSKVNNFEKETKEDTEDEKVTSKLSKKEQRKKDRELLIEKKRKLLELARNRLVSNGGTVKLSEEGKLIIEKKPISNDELSLQKDVEDSIKTELDTPTEEELINEKIRNKVEIPITNCIFCNKNNETVDSNVQHLFKKHGLYIPERDYLTDLNGLIEYLYEKIGYGNVCLSCNFQGKNFQSIVQHMLSKNHIRIPYESEDEKLEFSEFYDFTKSYGDIPEGADDEWEDVEGGGEEEDDEEEELIRGDELYATDYGLHLPNGLIAGHRSLARYYRQNLKPEKELTEGQGTVLAAETRNFVKTVDQKQLQENKRVWQRQEKSKDRDDRRAAKFINWQPHFRDELLQ